MLDRHPENPLLDAIKEPGDLRRLNEHELRKVADELRAETISAVVVTGDTRSGPRCRRTHGRVALCLRYSS